MKANCPVRFERRQVNGLWQLVRVSCQTGAVLKILMKQSKSTSDEAFEYMCEGFIQSARGE